MILAREKILEFAQKNKLIENFDIECLESAGYDLRIKTFYRLLSDPLLGKDTRKLPDIEEVAEDSLNLKPGDYVLLETLEKVNMPKDLAARVLNRSSVFRCGCTLVNALVDPGYMGTLTFGLKNLSDQSVTIEKGARVAQIVFETVDGKTKEYSGRYQGGKVV